MPPVTSITTTPRQPIAQEMLKTYQLIERAAADCRHVMFDLAKDGRPTEPGPLAINVTALFEPAPSPLVISTRAADALREAARRAGSSLEVIENPADNGERKP